MPLKSGSLKHIQLAYREALDYLTRSLIGQYYDNNKFYVLYGCVNSGTGLNYDISEGAIFYNGEIYLVDAASFLVTSPNVAVCNFITQYYSGTDADTVEFTDSVNRNVHEIVKITISEDASGAGLVDYSDLIFTNLAGTGASILSGSFSNATGSATYTGGVVGYTKSNGIVSANFELTVTPATYSSGALSFYVDLTNYIPYPVAFTGFIFGAAPCAFGHFAYQLAVSPTAIKNATATLSLQSGTNTPFLQVTLFDTTTSQIKIIGQITYKSNT